MAAYYLLCTKVSRYKRDWIYKNYHILYFEKYQFEIIKTLILNSTHARFAPEVDQSI